MPTYTFFTNNTKNIFYTINEQITKVAQKAAIFVCCTKIFLALITQMFLAWRQICALFGICSFIVKTNFPLLEQKIQKNIFENIETVYQLCFFRRIINLPYEVTPLFIYCSKFIIHWKCLVRHLLWKKVVKWCIHIKKGKRRRLFY